MGEGKCGRREGEMGEGKCGRREGETFINRSVCAGRVSPNDGGKNMSV